jgi:uncharacterized protein YjbI with pentapeptide repeats
MLDTLKSAIDCYQNDLVKTNRFEVIDRNFSNEIIIFEDKILADLTLYYSTFKNSSLTNIKFLHANLDSSFFESCLLENCVFEETSLNSIEFYNCKLKNCKLIDSNFIETNFTKTIFDECQFEMIKKGSLEQAFFESCHFIKTNFNFFTVRQLASAVIIDSEFSDYNKSIKFNGDFYLADILRSENGITGMFFK